MSLVIVARVENQWESKNVLHECCYKTGCNNLVDYRIYCYRPPGDKESWFFPACAVHVDEMQKLAIYVLDQHKKRAIESLLE